MLLMIDQHHRGFKASRTVPQTLDSTGICGSWCVTTDPLSPRKSRYQSGYQAPRCRYPFGVAHGCLLVLADVDQHSSKGWTSVLVLTTVSSP